jgi:hypothetical protein
MRQEYGGEGKHQNCKADHHYELCDLGLQCVSRLQKNTVLYTPKTQKSGSWPNFPPSQHPIFLAPKKWSIFIALRKMEKKIAYITDLSVLRNKLTSFSNAKALLLSFFMPSIYCTHVLLHAHML